MQNRRLIDRQTGLLRHLTSEAFIFGTRGLETAALDPDLQGMDFGRLRLEAEFSFNKRISRIRNTFARMATFYGDRFAWILREFAAACPPRTYERYHDAQQFFDWYQAHRADDRSVPPWTIEVARVEVTLARARTFRPAEAEEAALATCPTGQSAMWYRTHPCVALTRCRFDVAPLFQPGSPGDDIEARDVPLAVLTSRRSRRPEIVELLPEAFDLLEQSPGWTRLKSGKSVREGISSKGLVTNLAVQSLMLVHGDARDQNRG